MRGREREGGERDTERKERRKRWMDGQTDGRKERESESATETERILSDSKHLRDSQRNRLNTNRSKANRE